MLADQDQPFQLLWSRSPLATSVWVHSRPSKNSCGTDRPCLWGSFPVSRTYSLPAFSKYSMFLVVLLCFYFLCRCVLHTWLLCLLHTQPFSLWHLPAFQPLSPIPPWMTRWRLSGPASPGGSPVDSLPLATMLGHLKISRCNVSPSHISISMTSDTVCQISGRKRRVLPWQSPFQSPLRQSLALGPVDVAPGNNVLVYLSSYPLSLTPPKLPLSLVSLSLTALLQRTHWPTCLVPHHLPGPISSIWPWFHALAPWLFTKSLYLPWSHLPKGLGRVSLGVQRIWFSLLPTPLTHLSNVTSGITFSEHNSLPFLLTPNCNTLPCFCLVYITIWLWKCGARAPSRPAWRLLRLHPQHWGPSTDSAPNTNVAT